MKRLFYTKSKGFCSEEEVQLENITTLAVYECGYNGTDTPFEHTHVYGDEWKTDDENHWKECSCGDKINITAHNFKWVVDKEATTAEKGSKHEECEVCGYKHPAVEIAKQQTTDPPNPPKTTANKSNTGTLTSPRTGDNSNLLLWTALLLVSIFGVAGATFYNRKKKIR